MVMLSLNRFALKNFCLAFVFLGAGVSFFVPTIVDVGSSKCGQNNQLKQHKLLLCLSSFKRPIHLSGQVYRLLNQTYQNFDLSVSIKGVPVDEPYYNTFKLEFDRFAKTGRVQFRVDENKAQFSNLLDTFRDVDISKYDYFCKIDDDDWYAPDYLESVNKALNKIPESEKKISAVMTPHAYILTEDIASTYMRYNNSDLSGPTMCFSREVMRIMLEIEKDPSLLEKYMDVHDQDPRLLNFKEDRVLAHFVEKNGYIQDSGIGEPKVIFGWQYRSVMRNDGYVKKNNLTK